MKDYPGGPYDIPDLEAIDRYIRQIPIKYDMVEIGTWMGRSASVLAKYAKEQGQALYCIDPFYGNMVIPTFDYGVAFDFIQIMVELDLFDVIRIIPLPSDKAACLPFLKRISILHIDGSHEFEDIKHDIVNFVPRVNNLVICHDTDFEGPAKAIQYIPNNFQLIFSSNKIGIWRKNDKLRNIGHNTR